MDYANHGANGSPELHRHSRLMGTCGGPCEVPRSAHGETSDLVSPPYSQPNPPPPGVSISNWSPGAISTLPICGSSSTRPSVRMTRLRPGAPGEPPARPNGETARLLERID